MKLVIVSGGVLKSTHWYAQPFKEDRNNCIKAIAFKSNP